MWIDIYDDKITRKKTEKISLKHEVSALKRRKLILQFIRERGSASAREMAVRFGVSEMTIRRDFHLLEEQGSVMVHYGGASLREEDSAVVDFLTRQGKLDQDKISIFKFNEISDYALIFTDDQVEKEIQRQIAQRGGRVEICI